MKWYNVNDDNGKQGKKQKLRLVKHANNKIAAKFIVCPWDDSVMGTGA